MKPSMSTVNDNSDGVAVVLLCPSMGTDHHGGPAHCTLVYGGETDGVSLQQAIIMDSTTRIIGLLHAPLQVRVIGTDMFGEASDERVLLLDPEPIMPLRLRVAHWHKSQYAIYKPHVATTETQPTSITFTHVALWYGTKRIRYAFSGRQ